MNGTTEAQTATPPEADEQDLEGLVYELKAELERERETRKKLEQRVDNLESLIYTKGSTENPTYKDIWIGDAPAGKILHNIKSRSQKNAVAVFGDDTDLPSESDIADRPSLIDCIDGSQPSAKSAQNRSKMLPLHLMYVDMRAGTDERLGAYEERAAHVFGRFAERMKKNGESNEVDASGQKLTANSQDVIEIMQDENVLDVKEDSWSKIAGRVMRDVQQLTITGFDEDEHECPSMDNCNHGLFEFRPGKPHSVAVSKEKFRDYLSELSDTDVTSADDGVDGGNTPEDDVQDSQDNNEDSRTNGDSDA